MLVEREWTREKRALTLQSCNSRRCGYMDASRVASVERVTVNPKEGGCVWDWSSCFTYLRGFPGIAGVPPAAGRRSAGVQAGGTPAIPGERFLGMSCKDESRDLTGALRFVRWHRFLSLIQAASRCLLVGR